MSKLAINTAQNVNLNYKLIGLGERFVAFLIDGLLLITYLTIMENLMDISDVFSKTDINEDEINANITMFDQVILLRMVIIVSEIIITSSRSNKTQRFSDEFINKLHFDIIGSSNVRFAVTNRNYKYSMGITSRYGAEIFELKRFFGQNKKLQSISRGEAVNINIYPGNEL